LLPRNGLPFTSRYQTDEARQVSSGNDRCNECLAKPTRFLAFWCLASWPLARNAEIGCMAVPKALQLLGQRRGCRGSPLTPRRAQR
jgi:hypothetical protein